MDNHFNQKRIDHIFHYSQTFDSLAGIINSGFSPSYCREEITDYIYLIPMVSFCNISIRDVDLYMRYGNYGIGMSIDWAINNRISPVIYVHETSPFNRLHSEVNKLLIWDMINREFADWQRAIGEAVAKGEEYKYTPPDDKYTQLLSDVNKLTVPALQFFKNWKVLYKEQEIITYQEREWRYIPELGEEKKIIPSTDKEFEEFSDKTIKPKPHLPEYALQINSITDIRYIIIKKEEERNGIIDCLKAKFGEQTVLDTFLAGSLLILTYHQVKNDF